MKQRQKKGFTIVELLVVIAVIAVLAAVLIPVMVYLIDDAKTSADEQTVASLNKLIASETGDFETASDAVEAANDVGYNLETLDLDSDNELVWDQGTGYFALIDEDGEEVYSNGTLSDSEYLWKIVSSDDDVATAAASDEETGAVTYAAKTIVASAATDTVYSYYLTEGYEPEITFSAGVDAGRNEGLDLNVEAAYSGILVNGNGGTVTISGSGSVTFYGEADYLTVDGATVTTAASSSVDTVYAKGGATVVVNGSAETLAATSDSTLEDAVTVGDDPSTDYAGGLGTAKYPYKIATAEQLLKIASGTDSSTAYYKLTADIDLSGASATAVNSYTSYYLSVRYAEIDGENGDESYGVTLGAGNSLFYCLYDSAVRNLDVTFESASGKDQTVAYDAANSTIENVDIYGTMNMTGNVGAYVLYVGRYYGSTPTLTLKDCTSYASVTATGYNALWVGYAFNSYSGTTLNYENCLNAGSFVSAKGAVYLANIAGSITGGSLTMNITGCGNTASGSVRITTTATGGYYNPYVYAINNSCAVTVNDGDETYTATTASDLPYTLPYNCSVGPEDEGLSLTLSDDNYLVVSQSSYSTVSYYVVRIGLYSKLTEGGTSLQYVTETIAYDSSATSYTSTLQKLSFIDSTLYTGSASNGDVVTYDGTSYYYFSVDGRYLTDGMQAATVFEVFAYDSSNNLVSSYSVSL